MSLKERLLNDLKDAMRDKDDIRKDTIQICRAAVLQVEKDTRSVLDDNGVVEILAREFKKRSETLSELGDRQDVIKKYKAEMEIISDYLPEQLTDDEIEILVRDAIAETGSGSPRDMGKVMQFLQPKIKGKADGRKVSVLVKKYLGS